MARGHPDFMIGVGKGQEGWQLQQTTLPPVWFYDDFEYPTLKWHVGVFGTVEQQTTETIAGTDWYPYNGDSMLVVTSAVAGTVMAYRRIGLMQLTSYIGISHFFVLGEEDYFLNANNSLHLIRMGLWTGFFHHAIEIAYNPRTYNWYYMNNVLGWTLLTNYRIDEDAWHFIKLIFDPVTHTYVTLQIDSNIINMRGIGYWYIANLAAAYCIVSIEARAAAAQTAIVLVDDYKITYGES